MMTMRTFVIRSITRLSLIALIALSGSTLIPITTWAQDASFECGTVDAQMKARYYSLYYEDYRNENWPSSINNLRWIIACAPEYPRNDDRNYERLARVYRGLAETTDDAAMTRVYLDSALQVYDTAVSLLNEAGVEADPFDWTFEKGRFIQSQGSNLQDLQSTVSGLYQEAYNLKPEGFQAYYINYIIADLINVGDKSGAISFMAQVETSHGDQADVIAMIEQYRNSLFTSPEERMDFLESQLADKADDIEIRKELFDIYHELEERDKMFEMGTYLLEASPSAEIYAIVAKAYLDDGQAQEALDLYTASETQADFDGFAREIHFNAGSALQQLGRLPQARTKYRAALAVDEGFGGAVMAIGDLYAEAVSSCSTFDREDRAVYWLVTDYYARAKSVDPNLEAIADRKIAQYKGYYPDQEALFFKGWSAGASYRVNYGCYSWINETTTVKAP
jgi:tetratricopeptide (TPR) repeat protein